MQAELHTSSLAQIQHLRDFFNAQDTNELSMAFDRFDFPIHVEEEELETLFNRYFVFIDRHFTFEFRLTCGK